MSLKFFHHRLSEALELANSGDPKKIDKGRKFLMEHAACILDDVTREEKIFTELIHFARRYEAQLNRAVDSYAKNKIEDGNSSVVEAVKAGKKIVQAARIVTKLSKDEELKSI